VLANDVILVSATMDSVPSVIKLARSLETLSRLEIELVLDAALTVLVL